MHEFKDFYQQMKKTGFAGHYPAATVISMRLNRHFYRFKSYDTARKLLHKLFDLILIQRRYYKLHYRPEKVMHKAKTTSSNTTILKLLSITHMHGSKSIVFSNTHHTHNTLLPTGLLANKANNITPLSGELKRGSRRNGINALALSGVALDGTSKAVSYADAPFFKTDKTRELNLLEDFLAEKYKPEMFLRVGINSNLQRCVFAIMRIRILWPDEYTSKKLDIEAKVKNASDCFTSLKNSYRWTRQSKISLDDRTCIEDAEHVISSLQTAIHAELPSPKNAEGLINNPFPMLFASKTSVAPLISNQQTRERIIYRPAKLGRDIQHVFVSDEHIEMTQQFLTDSGLQDKIEVRSLADLEEAAALDKAASPYLSDILGSKFACK